MSKPEGLKRSQRQESRLAKTFGGTVNSGSGNGPYRKNDVRAGELSIEAKTTKADSFSLKLEDLLKAEKHALMDGRTFVFAVEMGRTLRRNYVVLAEEDFLRLTGREEL